MTILIFKLVGGIGLFLMGIVLLTDGLKAYAGGYAGLRESGVSSLPRLDNTLQTAYILLVISTVLHIIPETLRWWHTNRAFTGTSGLG